jgi:hypothetical protein
VQVFAVIFAAADPERAVGTGGVEQRGGGGAAEMAVNANAPRLYNKTVKCKIGNREETS